MGGRLELLNVSDKIKKIFEMAGILKIIPIIDVSLESQRKE